MERVNFEGFEWINKWAGHFHALDIIMLWLTDSVPYIAVALMAILWFSGGKEQHSPRRYTALYAMFSTAAGLFINFFIHLFYYHPRPFVVHHVQQLVPHVADSSFVSDHALIVFAFAWMLLLRKEKWRVPFFILAVMVALSRIYLGVHYPLDVIGSALIALVTGLFIVSLSKRLEPIFGWLLKLYGFLISLVSARGRKRTWKQ